MTETDRSKQWLQKDLKLSLIHISSCQVAYTVRRLQEMTSISPEIFVGVPGCGCEVCEVSLKVLDFSCRGLPKNSNFTENKALFCCHFPPLTFSSVVLKTRLANQLALNAFQCGSYTTRFIRFYLLFDDILYSQVQ